MSEHILFIEDDTTMALGLQFNLQKEGYQVTHVESIEEAPSSLDGIDLLILDRMLPGKSGLEFLRELRQEQNRLPVLVLSAKGDNQDVVEGLQEGADDYLTKPFDLAILQAKIRSLLRGRQWLKEENQREPDLTHVTFGKNWIDFAHSTAGDTKTEYSLNYKETLIMKILIAAQGEVVTREYFLQKVWDIEAKIVTRTLDNYIVQLRKKFELDPKKPKHILKVHGQGYRFQQ